MTRVVLAIEEPLAASIAERLEDQGIAIVARLAPGESPRLAFGTADAVLAPASAAALTAEFVESCDRAGIRIVPFGAGDARRLLARYGLPPALPADASTAEIAAALSGDTPAPVETTPTVAPRVIAVWGPQGAPGRSTVAIQLATELARQGLRTALFDADTVAPSIALLLGLGDDAPGIAAACRRAELGGLDSAELSRLAAPVDTSGGRVEVLAGLNRPSRWPELSAPRLQGALRAGREWAERIVVDTAAAFDADDEVTWDMEGPRRFAATTTVLREADEVIAVATADPLGIARFLRDHAELRGLVPDTPIRVVVNRVRPGPLGIDARGQVRRTLERFAGITDVTFLPEEQGAVDASLLHAKPVSDVIPRSRLVAAIRRLAAGLGEPGPSTAGSRRGSSRVARSLRRGPAVPATSRRGSDPEWAS